MPTVFKRLTSINAQKNVKEMLKLFFCYNKDKLSIKLRNKAKNGILKNGTECRWPKYNKLFFNMQRRHFRETTYYINMLQIS